MAKKKSKQPKKPPKAAQPPVPPRSEVPQPARRSPPPDPIDLEIMRLQRILDEAKAKQAREEEEIKRQAEEQMANTKGIHVSRRRRETAKQRERRIKLQAEKSYEELESRYRKPLQAVERWERAQEQRRSAKEWELSLKRG